VIEIEALYRSHGTLVLRRARTLLGNEHDAQEALQEVFASLLRSPAEAGISTVAWLYQSTTHYCLNQLRNRRTATRLLELRPPPEPPGPRAEALCEVRSLLSKMEPQVAAAVVYHHLDGMTLSEAAEILGCSRRQVGYLLERAQQALQQLERSA
jgi:RNA polymerase sigma factor (sigma-70 family)